MQSLVASFTHEVAVVHTTTAMGSPESLLCLPTKVGCTFYYQFGNKPQHTTMLVVVLCDGIECAIPKSGNHRQKRVNVETRMLMLR